jgi:predicted PurR-regulated permease PerM
MPSSQQSAPEAHSFYLYVILGAALFAFIQSFALLSPILLSFLLILLISLAFNPLILRMRSLTGGRRGATGLITSALLVLIVLIGWTFFGPLHKSVSKLSEQLPEYWERLQKPLIKMEQQAVLAEKKMQDEVTTEIARSEAMEGEGKPESVKKMLKPVATKEPVSFRSTISQMLQGVVGRFMEVAFNATQILIVLVTVFFGVIYTLTNPQPIFGTLFSVVPERHHARTLIIMQRIVQFVPGWAGATLLGMTTIGVLVFLLMLPIFGFKDALVLGLIAFMLEIIPFLGPVLSTFAALLLALGKGGMAPLWVLLAYTVIQALEGNVILPFILASSMKLHPVAVIFSMLLCVAVFGVLGVLVAAPLVAIFGIIHDELYRKHFLPNVTDEDLDRLARKALEEKNL